MYFDATHFYVTPERFREESNGSTEIEALL